MLSFCTGGTLGVFDVGEIVAVLEDENGVDIQVLDIPPEARFVDHMVVVSAKSLRHMRAMAASIEWLVSSHLTLDVLSIFGFCYLSLCCGFVVF